MLLQFVGILTMLSALDGQTLSGPTHDKKVICYWPTWAYYDFVPGHPRFQLNLVNPSLCTHIVYFGAQYDLDKNIIKTKDPALDLNKNNGMGNFRGVVSLKQRYPHLTVLIAVGSEDEGAAEFSKMASEPELRKTFVRNVMRFLNRFRFDGMDFHWLYPTEKEGAPYDRENFVIVAMELKEAFKPRGYILTTMLGIDETLIQTAYDLPKLSRHFDLIQVRSWNYHDSGDGVIGANAPLSLDNDNNANVEFTINYLLSQVPAHKLVLALSFEAITFILKSAEENHIVFGETKVKNEGFKGKYTKNEGYLNYIEVCSELSNKSSTWTYHWDEDSTTPYLRDKERVISYDSPRSFAAKIKFAVDKGLGGFLVWTLDADDYLGICSPESHHEAEAYTDFTERLDEMNNDPDLEEALISLNFPAEKETDNLNSESTYVVSNGRLKLLLSQVERPRKYRLLRFFNEAITIAIQEKILIKEIERIKDRENILTRKATNVASKMKPTKVKILPVDLQH